MKNKKGISLIVLIITIIVVIILAAAVILSLNNNNPISSAKEATFKSDIKSFQDELAMTISKEYTDSQGQRDEKINTDNYITDVNDVEYDKSIYKYIFSFKNKYDGKLKIQDDELVYAGSDTKEIEWVENLGLKIDSSESSGDGVQAKDIDKSYYGKTVSNYEIPDITGITWKVFYADETNIYLISSDYIDPTLLPTINNVGPNITGNSSYPKAAYFTNILSQYSGSSNITDTKLKALNNDYFNVKNYTSTYDNMKSVAYMMDTGVWNKFKDKDSKADYVIGGPTIEMLFNSYNKTHPDVNYQAQASSATGYQISKDGGSNWAYYYSNMLSTSDSLYVLPSSSGADGMWVASPSDDNSDYVMYVGCGGGVYRYYYNAIGLGFRPVVSLKSGVYLKVLDDWNVELKSKSDKLGQ